jgi:HK97 family phage prohead protease
MQLESRGDGSPARLAGYAVRFNVLSKDLGGFQERIIPGAFDAVLKSGADIRALFDHDSSKLLGRTSAGTLRVGKDDRGLWFSVDLPDTTFARDLAVSVKRGDIRGMSFGFRVPPGGDRFIRGTGGTPIREVTAMDLKEITVTSIPAYPDTSVALRVSPTIVSRLPQTWSPCRENLRRRMAIVRLRDF